MKFNIFLCKTSPHCLILKILLASAKCELQVLKWCEAQWNDQNDAQKVTFTAFDNF